MGFPYQHGNYGDYYAGDYYAGDIFGSILGGIKKVAGVVGSVIPGPIGAVAKVVSGIGGGSTPVVSGVTPPTLTLPRVSVGSISTPAVSVTMPGFSGGTTLPVSGGGGTCGGPGYHTNKALARWQRARARGSNAKQPHVVNTCVKNRSMNPLNPRALRRAIRRQEKMQAMMVRSLKGSGYKIVRTATRARRKR